jgi:hypothetical protein
MLGPCLAFWTVTAGVPLGPEAFWGTAGPLVAAMASWIAYERGHAVAPERLTSVMIGAFAAKLVFFVGYVGVSLGVLKLRPGPFAGSFVSSFIVLYAIEGMLLRRLVTGGSAASGGQRVLGS